MPSFEPESAVYIVEPKEGPPVVVSRTLKRQIWTSMMEELAKASPSGSFGLDVMAEAVALSKVRAATETRRAEISPETVVALGAACRDVLLRVRYPKSFIPGVDGTTYHAGHWIPGAFLSGTTWSPKVGTVAHDFVQIGETLARYAQAEAENRRTLEADLVARADRIRRRLRVAK